MAEPFRVLVCGSRTWTDEAPIRAKLEELLELHHKRGMVVIEGEAPGADLIARKIAEEMKEAGERVYFRPYPAEWNKYGKAAGPRRNMQMLVEGKPDLVLAFHDYLPASKGTKNMVEQARKAGYEVIVWAHDEWLRGSANGEGS